MPVRFAKRADVEAGVGVNLDLSVVGDSCALSCFALRYWGVALAQDMCRCLEDPASVPTQGQYEEVGDLVSVFNVEKFQPKPDGKWLWIERKPTSSPKYNMLSSLNSNGHR